MLLLFFVITMVFVVAAAVAVGASVAAVAAVAAAAAVAVVVLVCNYYLYNWYNQIQCSLMGNPHMYNYHLCWYSLQGYYNFRCL